MRIIYWRRYGVVLPLVIVVASTSLAIVGFHFRVGSQTSRPRAGRGGAAAGGGGGEPSEGVLVKRPNIDDDPDEDGFDDELITDPEDVWTDRDAIALNPDVIPEGERLKGRARNAPSGGRADDGYATSSASGLVEDGSREEVTTEGATTAGRSTADEERHAVTSPPQRPDVRPAQDAGGEHLFGLPDYHSPEAEAGGRRGAALMDFQEDPLSPDEEYSMRMDDSDAELDEYDEPGAERQIDAEAPAERPSYSPPPGRPMNVLFIIADDMRPQLGAYAGRDSGAPYDRHRMHTPNIDRLAERSLVLTRAYAQYSMCGPSRASLMTSRRPDVTKVYQNYVYWRYWSVGNFTTIPQYFKEHGYATLGAGKVFHVDQMPKDYDPPSWSLPYFRPVPGAYDRNSSVNWAAVPDGEPLVDQSTTRYAVRKLAELRRGADDGVPFFFAVGFNQPHFRHVCPARYFELYPLERRRCMYDDSWLTPPYAQRMNLAPLADGVDNADLTHIPSAAMRQIRRAYFACISYVDGLVGELTAALDDNGLADSTVVVLLSDQGYHLGDNGMFGVYSNHDVALHVPLVVRIPGRTDAGVVSRSLAELVDVFPTLVEAVGLPPVPRCPERSSDVRVCTDGVSLLPLLAHPKAYVKEAVYSQLSRGRSLTEYAVRTNKYRLIDLALHRRTKLYPGVYQHALDFDLDLRFRRHGRHLYDLVNDPLESQDVIDDPRYADTVDRLRAKLRHTFKNVHDYSKYLYYSFPE